MSPLHYLFISLFITVTWRSLLLERLFSTDALDFAAKVKALLTVMWLAVLARFAVKTL